MAKVRREHSTAIRRRIKSGIFLLFAAALMVAALGPQRVFACDVTDVDLWIGDTQSDAEEKNPDAVFKRPGCSFGWYVEWDADDPDYEDFYGEIFLASTRVDTFTAGPTDRNESGTATVPSTMSLGGKTVRAWMRRVGGEWCPSNTRTLTVAEVASVTSDKDGACVGCSIWFEVTTSPPGYGGYISWSAPGGDPSTSIGPTFWTRWYTPGTKTVTASLCDSSCECSKSKQVTVAAPTNFHLVEWWDIGDGDIQIHYEWDSTSGDLEDLDGCVVGEIVYYPYGDPPYYYPPDPPFDNWVIPNPTVVWAKPATDGWLLDTHGKGGGFSKPYYHTGFTATQYERYRNCLETITTFWGPVSITREVYELVSEWYYSTTKEDAYATAPLPP